MRHGRARHPPRALHSAAPRPLRRARPTTSRREDHRRPLSRQPRARRRCSRTSTQSALETLSTEAAVAIENARLYREALDKREVRAGAAGRRGDPAGRCCRRREVAARSSRRAGASCPAARSAATSSTTSTCRTAGSASSSATSPARDRRRRSWPPPCIGMFGAEARIRRARRRVIVRLNTGLFRRAIECALPDRVLRRARATTASSPTRTPGTMRRCSCRLRRAPSRNRRHGARSVRARRVRRGNRCRCSRATSSSRSATA